MDQHRITIKDIEPLVPFSRGSTEIFLTGQWSPRKPIYVEKTSPCRQGCPIGNDIARAFACAARGDYDEALRIYRQENPLPGVCGRVCYQPCEGECNRKDFDEAINIRGFERFLADHGTVDTRRELPLRLREERIAVIGSGPAGLSAAYHLARLGYPVTIFEALPEPGGMLMYGIPEYRLPKAVLRREIGYIKQSGVHIRTGVRVGAEEQGQLSLARIRRDFQAVFIGVGAHRAMRVGVEGEELPGLLEGIGFLRGTALGEKRETGRRVAVVGGGNTAMDCARTARRMGAEEVRIICPEMPALAEEVAAARREGVKIEPPSIPTRIISKNGRVSSLECIATNLETGAGGRVEFVPLKGSEFVVPADTIIVAVGQTPEADFLRESGVTINEKGFIEISAGTAATSMEGVFAGGDGAAAKGFVADAIASGKMGALAIFCFFEGKDVKKELEKHSIGYGPSFSFRHLIDRGDNQIDLKNIVTYDRLNTICVPHASRNQNPERLGAKQRLGTFREVSSGLSPGLMEAEVSRCFTCGTCTRCDLCFLLCPDISIMRLGEEGYRVRTDFCKGCGVCATTCPRHVIEMEDYSPGSSRTTAGGGL